MTAIFAGIACGAAVGAEAAGVAVWAARVEVARPAASARAKAWVRFIGVGELLTKFRDSRRTAVLSAGWLSAGVHMADCRAVRTSMGAREGPPACASPAVQGRSAGSRSWTDNPDYRKARVPGQFSESRRAAHSPKNGRTMMPISGIWMRVSRRTA